MPGNGFATRPGVEGLYTRQGIPNVARRAHMVTTREGVSTITGLKLGRGSACALRRAACTWLAQDTSAVAPHANTQGSCIRLSVHTDGRDERSERSGRHRCSKQVLLRLGMMGMQVTTQGPGWKSLTWMPLVHPNCRNHVMTIRLLACQVECRAAMAPEMHLSPRRYPHEHLARSLFLARGMVRV